jgi:hypothetical protein
MKEYNLEDPSTDANTTFAEGVDKIICHLQANAFSQIVIRKYRALSLSSCVTGMSYCCVCQINIALGEVYTTVSGGTSSRAKTRYLLP